MKTLPPDEVWFVWKEFTVVEGEEEAGPRLLTPWGNPDLHEFPADFMFATVEEAAAWKKENAPYETWVLCEEITRTLSWSEAEDENQTRDLPKED